MLFTMFLRLSLIVFSTFVERNILILPVFKILNKILIITFAFKKTFSYTSVT